MLPLIINSSDSTLVKVFSKNTDKQFIDTGEVLLVKTKNINEYGLEDLFFMKHANNSSIFWLMKDKKKINQIFYCSLCDEFYAGGGSNVSSHLNTIKHKTKENPEKISPIDAFILWMVHHSISLNSLNDDLFHIFLNGISYKLITDRIEIIYKMLFEKIKCKLSEQDNIVIIADGWADKRGRRYLGIAARYVENGSIKNILIGLNDIEEIHHTALHIGESIGKTIHELEIENKIISICTDSDAVMPAAVEMLGYEWDPCFVHIFNNIVRDFMENNPIIYSILQKANVSRKKEVFVSYLELNHAPLANIKKYSKTRWMSCYDSIQSISILKDYIQNYSIECKDQMFTEEEFSVVDIILPFMTHLNEAYEMLIAQEENFFTSLMFRVITTIIELTHKVEEDVPFLCFGQLRDAFIENFLNPNKKSCSRILYSIILDKSHHIPSWFIDTNNYKIAMNTLYEEIEKLRTDAPEQNDSTNLHNHESKEHYEYDLNKSFAENMFSEVSEEPTSEVEHNELIDFIARKPTKKSFIEFWTSKKTMIEYPLLTKFVRKLMSHSFTSLYIERCFSHSKRTLNYDRLSMTKEHASMQSVMKVNLPMAIEVCQENPLT